MESSNGRRERAGMSEAKIGPITDNRLCIARLRPHLPIAAGRLVKRCEGGSGVEAIGGVQGIIWIVLVGRIKWIIGSIAVGRIEGIPGIELVCRIVGIVGRIGLCRVQGVVRGVLIGRIEDVVVALILLVEAHLGPSETEREKHRSQDEKHTHKSPLERRWEEAMLFYTAFQSRSFLLSPSFKECLGGSSSILRRLPAGPREGRSSHLADLV
jgi:hypothetical protein